MARFKFAARLYPEVEIIHAEFRAHQATVLQLATHYKVGQESMRQFLMKTLGEEYREIVQETREILKTNNRQSVLASVLQSKRGEMIESKLNRRMSDFGESELKEFRMRIEQRAVNPVVNYHPYIVSPLLGDL